MAINATHMSRHINAPRANVYNEHDADLVRSLRGGVRGGLQTMIMLT